MSKKCTHCGRNKPVKEFSNRKCKNKKGETYHRVESQCKQCVRDRLAKWYLKNPTKPHNYYIKSKRKAHKNYTHKPRIKKAGADPIEKHAKQLLAAASTRSKKKNIGFDLDMDWIMGKLKLNVCEATGLSFEPLPEDVKNFVNNPFSPSIDRIDPFGGYTKDNCQMVCLIYNRAKFDFDINDLHKMIKAYVENNNGKTVLQM